MNERGVKFQAHAAVIFTKEDVTYITKEIDKQRTMDRAQRTVAYRVRDKGKIYCYPHRGNSRDFDQSTGQKLGQKLLSVLELQQVVNLVVLVSRWGGCGLPRRGNVRMRMLSSASRCAHALIDSLKMGNLLGYNTSQSQTKSFGEAKMLFQKRVSKTSRTISIARALRSVSGTESENSSSSRPLSRKVLAHASSRRIPEKKSISGAKGSKMRSKQDSAGSSTLVSAAKRRAIEAFNDVEEERVDLTRMFRRRAMVHKGSRDITDLLEGGARQGPDLDATSPRAPTHSGKRARQGRRDPKPPERVFRNMSKPKSPPITTGYLTIIICKIKVSWALCLGKLNVWILGKLVD